METDEHRDTYAFMTEALKRAGMKSHALVAVDEEGHVYWGASFAHEPGAMLNALRTIEHDIEQHLKVISRSA